MTTAAVHAPNTVQFVPSAVYGSPQPNADDPFRHHAGANSHNHHGIHPWGQNIVAGTDEFDALYAKDNNQYMYHLWYSDKLAPYMATELLKIQPLSSDLMSRLQNMVQVVLEAGIDTAMQSENGKSIVTSFQAILDDATQGSKDPIFVRLGATSAKDSFAKGAPTTKPSPLAPDADLVLRRLLTSGRVVGRLLALADRVWPEDPGEALIVQRWSPSIDLQREIRVFCYEGCVTAASQDIWWEKAGWRDRYADGFIQAINDVWANVKDHLPFNTCTMDVLLTPPAAEAGGLWTAKIIEFNGFGAHLNTGSDLFHWTKDADVLQGRTPGVTVRFVDDWEHLPTAQEDVQTPQLSETISQDEDEPDWLVLEKQLQAKYADKAKDSERLKLEAKTKLPLRGRWCSAY
ncbi:hypothetical protein B0T21DRAFT_358708 [Apiosordaria backusii]|uniref:Cell division cycle protein 123 n=1 Tax=Apiosordaria backusii TaxID=314023 RepID=A0AA40K3U9_9PEZI|nr:hypothetical protein B0T21DRAFT_358708 [Apiosordaria backusii]